MTTEQAKTLSSKIRTMKLDAVKNQNLLGQEYVKGFIKALDMVLKEIVDNQTTLKG